MNLRIVPEDRIVIIDGRAVKFDFSSLIDPEIHAVQWDGISGEVEFKNHSQANRKIADIAGFQSVVEAYYQAVEHQKKAAEKAEADRQAIMTYRQRRTDEYPPQIEQLEAIWDVLGPSPGSEAEKIKAKVQAIKAKYPKSGV